ncbi:acyl carrier protein [Streptomyces orinoci]|uniref:Acyl carrier protein n=1 Tax=Streptomyces orinoci TaxID=67339 RepID=A0ABV3K3I0_STRON|nr:acyl carrier protein [Streptomyces orinoci]
MTQNTFTLADLKRILLEGAGADSGSALEGDITDATFEELGYDSLALLETSTRIEREFHLAGDDDALITAKTPRELIELVNAQLAASV